MVDFRNLEPVDDKEYTVYDADKNLEYAIASGDDVYGARFRYAVQYENRPRSDFFGKVERKPEKEYVSPLFRGLARTGVSFMPTMKRELSRMGTDIITGGVKFLNDLQGNALDAEIAAYEKQRGVSEMSEQDRKAFYQTDKYYNQLFRMRQRSYQRDIDLNGSAFKQSVDEVYGELKKANERFISEFGFDRKENDSEFMYNLGNGAGSLLGALALNFVTKNPMAAAVAFGLSQSGAVYEELREKGVEPSKAVAFAAPAGVAEGALEKFGLHLMIENMHAKTWAKGVLKSFLSETVQEGSQQFAEEALMYRFRDQETAVDKAKRILESSLYGGILGSTATIAGRPVVLRHVKAVERKLLSCEVDGIDKQKAHELAYNAAFGNEKEQDAAVEEIQRIIALGEAKKAGFKEEYALKFAEKAVVPNSEIQDMIVTAANAELDPETYEGGSIESGVKFLDERLKEINPVNEDFDIKERVKVAALENGASEEDAEFAGIATENFARVISNVTGETPREQWENGGKLTIGAQSETDRADWADIPVVPVDEKSAPDFENLIPVSEEDASALGETFDYNGESTSGQGTYVGEDGGIYLADGTLLFQDGKPESAKTREGGPEIAADDEVVEAVRIDENAMPEFKTKKELVEFIKDVLGKERNITVKSTKETVLVSNKGIERGATKTRSKKYNEAFASIKSLLENAKYSGFIEADERHPNVKGQDVYHSALIIGNQPYSVRFKVDIPKETGTHNYAGHGISEIKIASADDAGGLFRVPSGQNRDATYKISMGVLRGKVNPARFDPHNKTLYQSAKQPRGSIEITEAGYVIRLLKNSDPSTIVHELGHYFTIRYLDALQKAGKIDEAKGVFEWLGVSGVQEMQKEHYEKFARGFETYVMEGRSPNSTMQTLFTRFKNFLIGVYRDMVTGKIIKPEEINDETRAFFDKMLAVDDDFSLDMATVRGKSEALKKVVSEAMNGKEVTVDGMGLEQVADLFEMMNARIPRKPDTLIQMLRKAGGIDLKLAKMLDLPHLMGLQDAKGGAAGLFRKGGAIRQEDQLVEFLKEKGFISGDDSDYRGASELWENALRVLENASQLYTSDGQMQMMHRTDLLEAAEMAAEILSGKNYDDVLNAVKALRKKDVAAVSKDTLKYIRSKIKQIDSDYQKLIKQMARATKKDFSKIQRDLKDFIRNQPLSAESKVKLLSKAGKAVDLDKYYRIAQKLKDKAAEYYDLELRKNLRGQIQKALKATRPLSTEKQRYDYASNTLFAVLREYNQMTQEEAQAAADHIRAGVSAEEISEFEESDKIKLRFLEAKAKGAEASAELLNAVLKDIQTVKEAGLQSKELADQEKSVNREEARQEILAKMNGIEADPERFKTKVMNIYRRGFANLYSLLNSLFGKEIAEKYEFEVKQTQTDSRIYEETQRAMEEAAKIFGVGKSDLVGKFAKMAEDTRDLYDLEGVRTKINRFHIMDIYNAIKNDKTREDYYRAYGKENIEYQVLSLTKEERLFADYLMREVNSYYGKMNEVYIKLYAIDLPKVENYWPATSLHKDQIDLLGDFQGQSSIPSALKERTKRPVTPKAVNALDKFNRHIAEAEYITGLGLDYMEMKRIFKSQRIKSEIVAHYGEGVYKDLMGNIETLSLKNRLERLDAVSSWLNKMLNNLVLAKIALAPSVFVKQLISVTNYTEQMPVGEWLKGFIEGVGHPKETIAFMRKELPFLKARLAGGQNEALVMALAEKRSDWKNILSALTRYGDSAAIIFGGYPYMKHLKQTGTENAEKKFMFATLRSQQSGTSASLSPFQQRTGFERIFLSFKNTPTQYMRKIVDAFVMKQNGDITEAEYRRILLNYGIVQPCLLALVGMGWVEMWKSILGDDDREEADLAQAMIAEIVLNPFAAVPLVSNAVEGVVDYASGKKVRGISSLLMDDLNAAARTVNKQDKDFFDYAEIIAPIIEMTTAAPVSRANRFIKKMSEEK